MGNASLDGGALLDGNFPFILFVPFVLFVLFSLPSLALPLAKKREVAFATSLCFYLTSSPNSVADEQPVMRTLT